MNLNTIQLCDILKGEFIKHVKTCLIKGVFIDSRETNSQQKVFFAIKGEYLDGHNFLPQAIKAGANTLVIHEDLPHLEKDILKGITIIKVDNTLKALHKLAYHQRAKHNLCVIGITGSSGKTTTKHFCFQLLKTSFFVQTNYKSFNNVYGVALTLLAITKQTDILIQELGTNQPGELKQLSALAKPNIVTVTHVGEAHRGTLGNINKIACEKQTIYTSNPKALPVFNLDNFYTKKMYQDFKDQNKKQKVICFSAQDKKADVFLQIKKLHKKHLWVEGYFCGIYGEALVPVTGAAHLNNILAASALSIAAGLKIKTAWERLSKCELPPGRNQWVKLNSGAEAFFDAYNASPESVIAFLDHFLSPLVDKKKFLILGDFLELGDDYLHTFHKKIAQKLSHSEISLIWFIGEQAHDFSKALKQENFLGKCYFSSHFDSVKAQKILSLLNPSIVVAFKASRKIKLEKVLMYFQPLDITDSFI